jgi:hypothetical protein
MQRVRDEQKRRRIFLGKVRPSQPIFLKKASHNQSFFAPENKENRQKEKKQGKELHNKGQRCPLRREVQKPPLVPPSLPHKKGA